MLNGHVYVAAHLNIYLLTPAVGLSFSWSVPTRMFEMPRIETPRMVTSALSRWCCLSGCFTHSLSGLIGDVTLVIVRVEQAVERVV